MRGVVLHPSLFTCSYDLPKASLRLPYGSVLLDLALVTTLRPFLLHVEVVGVSKERRTEHHTTHACLGSIDPEKVWPSRETR